MYNKFDVGFLDHRPRHPTSDYDCVVETAGQWRAARCAEEHLTICQSDHYMETGKRVLILISVTTLFVIRDRLQITIYSLCVHGRSIFF